MSMQEESNHNDTPDQTSSSSSSSNVINRGNQDYDPFAPDDDDNHNQHENEQLIDKKQESVRINNGTSTHPVINPDQQARRKSKSPIKHSDRRSKSPHRNHYSSDRKRLRTSSPDSSPPSTNTDSSKSKKPSRNDYDQRSKYHRSPSDSRRSSKSDDHYHSHRYNSSRNYHSSHNDRRLTNTNHSSLSPSVIHNNDRQSSKEDRTRISNRSKNVKENNTTVPTSNSNKTSSSGPVHNNTTNGGSQRSRSNLIQIVTTEATQTPPVRLQSTKPSSTPTTNTKDSTNTETNGGTVDNMLMEEMLLEAEQQEQNPVKSIDLDSLTIPENSIKKLDNKDESIKPLPTTSVPTPTTTTTTVTTSNPSLTPSPTKKPYTLIKVRHTNHMTPPLLSQHKKQAKIESTNPPSDTVTKSSNDDNSRSTSLEERLSNIFGVPPTSSNKIDQPIDIRTNSIIQTTPTSDKSTDSPQDIKSLISTINKKDRDHSSLTDKIHINDERRSTPAKHYTTEWIATQKPEEAPPAEELSAPLPLPTLVSTQSIPTNPKGLISTTGETATLGKLSEIMTKFIQKQVTTTEPDETVPISAKHLERLERRKQREKRQSEIAAIAKEALKPAFRKHTITKDEYKEIMKKVVTKATHANEIDRVRISKMIDAYIEKYRTIRQHNQSKTSKNSTINNNNNNTEIR